MRSWGYVTGWFFLPLASLLIASFRGLRFFALCWCAIRIGIIYILCLPRFFRWSFIGIGRTVLLSLSTFIGCRCTIRIGCAAILYLSTFTGCGCAIGIGRTVVCSLSGITIYRRTIRIGCVLVSSSAGENLFFCGVVEQGEKDVVGIALGTEFEARKVCILRAFFFEQLQVDCCHGFATQCVEQSQFIFCALHIVFFMNER